MTYCKQHHVALKKLVVTSSGYVYNYIFTILSKFVCRLPSDFVGQRHVDCLLRVSQCTGPPFYLYHKYEMLEQLDYHHHYFVYVIYNVPMF